MTSWIDYYRAIWREAVRGGGPLTGGPHRGSLGERFARAVEGFAREASRELREAGWDCISLEALVREIKSLARVLRGDLAAEARLYDLDSGLASAALEALEKLEEAAGDAVARCRRASI